MGRALHVGRMNNLTHMHTVFCLKETHRSCLTRPAGVLCTFYSAHNYVLVTLLLVHG